VTAVTAPHCTHPSIFIDGEERFPNVPIEVVLSYLNDEPDIDMWRFGVTPPASTRYALSVTWKLGSSPSDPTATVVTTPIGRLRDILAIHGIPADTADAIVTDWVRKATTP
jgi:hypothetical protein